MTEKEKEVKLDQDGKMINPHNPDFITKVPWYLGNSGPTLKHHAVQKSNHVLSMSESDALIEQKLAAQKYTAQTSTKTVYRKGACKNCGALTHNEKDCVERPRSTKKSAWKSGLDIAPDEVVLKLEDHGKVSYDAKRDQWKGYDPEAHKAIIEKHERMEIERINQMNEQKEEQRRNSEERNRNKKEEKEQRNAQRRAKAAAKAAAGATGESNGKKAPKGDAAGASGDKESGSDDDSNPSDSDSDSDYGSDEEEEDGDGTGAGGNKMDFVERDEEARDFQGTMAPQGGIGGNGMRQTVRNLRLREDTPKYLRNLALDSAFYDPKSRAMRANPLPDENPEDLAFAGDNFIRYSGDAVKLAQNQLLCWEMQARGESIDVISNPSQAELLQRQFAEKKQKLEETKRLAVLAKYSDGKAPVAMDPRLKLGQTEAYLEYNRDGRLIKGAPTPVVRTKYEEDVYINNHTSVFGSYYNRARATWGYSCCHSGIKNSYCTGAKGREANDAVNSEVMDSFQARKMLDATQAGKASGASSSSAASALTKRSDVFGEGSTSTVLDKEKLEQAYRKAEQGSATGGAAAAESAGGEERKRGYNSMQSVEVTTEDMEVYRMKRLKGDDPMAALMESDTLLEYK
jgi:pre-mRNA-processing factor SLU7